MTWLMRGEWLWAGLAGALGLLALVTSLWRWAWPASVNLLVLLAASAVGTILNKWAALGSALCGLIAWDAELFARRLAPYSEVPDALVRTHLWRLGAIVLISGILGATALSVTISLSFGWVLLLAFGFLAVFLLLLRQGLRAREGGGGGEEGPPP
ncbi:MAG: hypothetical protein N3E42_00055 [Candidatus Bipolaricaulota bacterium]|nr:hypothetical protein [Candidatus Bipolaricaulota bacterium]